MGKFEELSNLIIYYLNFNNFSIFNNNILEGGYLIGTTNFMIKDNKLANADIVVDIDTSKIDFVKP